MKKSFIFLIALLMVSCFSSRNSSKAILEEINRRNIESVEIYWYSSKKYIDSDSMNSYVYNKIIDSSLSIDLTSFEDIRKKIISFLNEVPISQNRNFTSDSLIRFKRNYLENRGIDSIDAESIVTPKVIRDKRINYYYYDYELKFNFIDEDDQSVDFSKYNDNIIIYSFCCEDYNSWMYRNVYKYVKGSSKYSREYVLDLEFQKRFVRLFNDILAKYNETNGTDYPLLDVDYEVWSGIISAP